MASDRFTSAGLFRWRPWSRRGPPIPAVRLSGLIGNLPLRGRGLSLATLERAIDRAFAVKRAPAVALLINSPGGSPVQSSLIAGRIRALAAEKQRPVIAFVEDVAASGGYWLATAADEIFADPSSVVGSIGVVSQGFGLHEAIARLGIERRVHTVGRRKALLDPFRPENPADVEVLKELQEDIFELFRQQVRHRRGSRLRAPEEELFDGRVWTGARALELGLIDGLGDARALIRERFGKTARLVVVNQPRSWLARRLAPGALAAGLIGDLVTELEERTAYAQFGL
jgi:signal peptide peptidase SppA